MAEDYREQWILHKGDSIQCAEDTYIISGDPIGFGGSAIIYPAVLEGKNNILEFALKECFPRKPERYMRKDGIVQPIDPTDEVSKAQLKAYHAMLEHEREVGQAIRNTSTRAVGIWKNLKPISVTVNGKAYAEASDGFYSVLERMDKKGLFFNEVLEKVRSETPKEKMRKTYGLPPIHFTACLMEQTLQALDRVHQAGYLFGDIQGANVFFSECNTESGSAGIGHLIDFGSSRKLQEEGYIELDSSINIFSTNGFCPPEIAERNDPFLRLGKQVDVYSAGCLMLRCVVSPAKVKMRGSSPSLGRNTLSEFDGEAIGCTPRVLQLVNTILERSANSDPSKRYKDAAEMLEAVLELKRASAPPAYLLPTNLSSPDYFVPHSRDRELAILENDLKRDKTVYIWGLGGIGKTEVAIKLAERFISRNAFLVHFKDSMKETVMQMAFSGYKFVPPRTNMPVEEVVEAEYQDRMRILREQYQDALFIVDNFNVRNKTLEKIRQETEFKDFLGLSILRVFTTRYTMPQTDWEIRALSKQNLLKLMRFYYTDFRISDDQMLELIHAVDGHTLAVELIGKTLEESWGELTPEMLLETFRNSALSQEDYPEVVSDQNREYAQKQIYAHLKALFNLSGMTCHAKNVLCCASLLPEEGLDVKLFRDCLEPTESIALKELVKLGWLERMKDEIVKIHPVIREVCYTELKPDIKKCGVFINKLWNNHRKIRDYSFTREKQLANYFANASNKLQVGQHYYAEMAGSKLREIGDFIHSIDFYLVALAIAEKSSEDALLKAARNSNVASAYSIAGFHSSSILFAKKAETYLSQMNLPGSHSTLAEIYGNLGIVYGRLGDHQKMIEYSTKAFAAFAAVQPNLEYAYACLNLSSAFIKLGDFSKSKKMVLSGIDVFEHELPKNHPLLAGAYRNLGAVYGHLGEPTKAVEYSLKAVLICESVLPANSYELAASYNSLAIAYSRVKDFTSSLMYGLMSVDIREHLPAHPDMAQSYQTVAAIYHEMNNVQKKLEYALKVKAVREKWLAIDHPDLAKAYELVSESYSDMGDFKKSLEYALKSVTVRKHHLPSDILELAKTYEFISQLFFSHGYHKEGIEYTLKCLSIIKKYSSLEQYDIQSVYFNTGLAYYFLKEYKNAFYYFDKANKYGNIDAVNNMGWMLIHGEGTKRDVERAMEFFYKAANAASPSIDACRNLGQLYLGILPGAPDFSSVDPEKALAYLIRAKELGATDVDALIEHAKKMI